MNRLKKIVFRIDFVDYMLLVIAFFMTHLMYRIENNYNGITWMLVVATLIFFIGMLVMINTPNFRKIAKDNGVEIIE